MNTSRYGFGLTLFATMMIVALLATTDTMAADPIEDFDTEQARLTKEINEHVHMVDLHIASLPELSGWGLAVAQDHLATTVNELSKLQHALGRLDGFQGALDTVEQYFTCTETGSDFEEDDTDEFRPAVHKTSTPRSTLRYAHVNL